MKFEINSLDFEERRLEQEALHKELDLIQRCITRMSHNAFLFKGWFITLASGLTAFSISSNPPLWVTGLGFTILSITIWLTDAFFLWTEKRYRKIYIWVLAKRREGDFTLQYDLNPTRFNKEKLKAASFFSWPSMFLYMPVFVVGLGLLAYGVAEGFNCG